MTRPPFESLKTSILLVLAAIAMATAGMVWSHRQNSVARMELQHQQTALKAVHMRQEQSRTDARLIAQHLDAYHALIARGFVGEENRLAWIEAVQLANRDARLYGLTYTLSPRIAAPDTLANGLPLKLTHMRVNMPLLVETDLQRFFDALHTRSPGIFRLSQCSLRRITKADFQPVNRPGIDAECELLWFTLAADTVEKK